MIRQIIGSIFLLGGMFVMSVSVLGLYRFKYKTFSFIYFFSCGNLFICLFF